MPNEQPYIEGVGSKSSLYKFPRLYHSCGCNQKEMRSVVKASSKGMLVQKLCSERERKMAVKLSA